MMAWESPGNATGRVPYHAAVKYKSGSPMNQSWVPPITNIGFLPKSRNMMSPGSREPGL